MSVKGWRVKVYKLDSESQWADTGCGYTRFADDPLKVNGQILSVESETDGSDLLVKCAVEPARNFIRQQDTLIVWQDTEGLDIALSFQELEGCVQVWASLNVGQEPAVVIEDETDIKTDIGECDINLPVCELSNLSIIADAVELAVDQPLKYSRDALATQVVVKRYIKSLLDVFEQCEDLESIEDLHLLVRIFMDLILLNVPCVVDELTEEDNILKVIGVFEYDPTQSEVRKHREFLTTQAKLVEAVPLPPAMVDKVHLNFRLQYLRDHVLMRQADDTAYTTINSCVYFTEMEIINVLSADDPFLDSLFAPLNGPSVTPEESCKIVLFLKDLVELSKKSSQMGMQMVLFEKIHSRGLLDALSRLLKHPKMEARQAAAELFVKTLTHDPVSVRQYIIKQFEHNARTPLLQTSIRSFIADTDDGTKTLCGECLRIVLDTDTMTGEKFQFLNRFYDKSFDELIGPLISVPEDQTDHRQYVSDKHNTLYSILELLTSQVLNHATFIKPQLLRNSLIHKLTSLLNDHYTYLSLGAVRFLRALLSLGDESILLCMQKRGVFGSVLSAYVTNGLRYNMLDSAIAELLSYIKGENMKSTIKYIVDHHRETIEKFKDQVAFKGLLQKHAQNEEMSTLETSRSDDVIGSLSQQLTSRYRPDARQLDAEEEDYFDDDDEFTEPSLELTMGSDHALDISMGNAIQPLGTSMENKTRAMAGTSAKNTTVDSLTGTGAGDSEEKLTELDAQAVKEVKERLRQSVYCDTEDNNSVLGGGGSIGASSYHSKNSGDTGLGMGLGRLSSFDTHTPTSTALHTHAAVGAKTGAQSLLERFTGVSDVSTTSMSTNTGTHANAGSHTDVMAHINTNTNGDTAAITSSGEHQSTPVRRTLAIVETPAGDALIENAKPINYSLKGVSDKENTHTGTNAPTQIHADGIDNTAATTLMLNGAVVATNTSASDSATTSSSTQTAGKSTEHVEPFSTADVRNDPAAATSELGSASKPLHNEETKPCAESLVTQDMAFLDSQTKSPEKGGVDTRVDTQTEPAVDTLVKKSVDNSHTSGQGVTRTARTGARRARWDVMGPVAKVEGTSDGVSQSGTQSRTPEHKHADSEVIIPSQPQQEKSGSSDLGPDKSVSTSNVGSTGSTEHPTRTNLDTSDTSRAAEAVIHSGEQVLPAASPAASNASQTCNLMSHQALQGSTTADANAEPKVEALETASVSRPVNAESGDSMRAETLTSTTHSTDTQSGRQEDQLTANTTTTPVATPKGSLNDRIADSSGESMSEANEHSVGASVAKSAGDQGVGLGSGDASKCSGIGPESSESQGDVSFRKRVQLAKSDVATHSSNKDASNSPPKRQRLES